LLAALQAPVIMMSQNRRQRRDAWQAALDYEVNIKAESSIADLHDKVGPLDAARAVIGEAEVRERLGLGEAEEPISGSAELASLAG